MRNNNMRNILLFWLYFVLSLKDAYGESENEIKRGAYMFMAVVYYPDPSIVDPSGARFTRSAILIRPDWLISSSLESNDTKLAFPQKTLMARVGAITIDSNFTINEDEGEQDQEIIHIVRPTNFNVTQWWNNDITLLKTLGRFMFTLTVGSTTLSVKRDYIDKACYILVFAKKYKNSTDDKMLMQLSVELLPSSNSNCGIHFRKETMICASNSDENKNIVYQPDFCNGNGGGPLLCEGDVIGLQTYDNNDCKQPYLYQLLSAWDDFISCGVDEKCRTPQCANICLSIGKDDDTITFGTDENVMSTSEIAKDLIMGQSTEDSNDDESILPDSTPKVNIFNENETPTPTTSSTTQITTTEETTPAITRETEEKTTSTVNEMETAWPKEKKLGHRKKLDEVESFEKMERASNVEAQRQEAKKKVRNAAERYTSSIVRPLHLAIFCTSISIYYLDKCF